MSIDLIHATRKARIDLINLLDRARKGGILKSVTRVIAEEACDASFSTVTDTIAARISEKADMALRCGDEYRAARLKEAGRLAGILHATIVELQIGEDFSA
jgi:hypothetical protein